LVWMICCLRHPLIPCARKIRTNASSVSLFPRERMRDITSERLALVKTSGIGLYARRAAVYSVRTMIVPISKIQVRRDEDGVWIAKSALLPGCHAHGQDRGQAILRFEQAAKAHLEALLETGRPIPPAFRDKFVLTA